MVSKGCNFSNKVHSGVVLEMKYILLKSSDLGQLCAALVISGGRSSVRGTRWRVRVEEFKTGTGSGRGRALYSRSHPEGTPGTSVCRGLLRG